MWVKAAENSFKWWALIWPAPKLPILLPRCFRVPVFNFVKRGNLLRHCLGAVRFSWVTKGGPWSFYCGRSFVWTCVSLRPLPNLSGLHSVLFGHLDNCIFRWITVYFAVAFITVWYFVSPKLLALNLKQNLFQASLLISNIWLPVSIEISGKWNFWK